VHLSDDSMPLKKELLRLEELIYDESGNEQQEILE